MDTTEDATRTLQDAYKQFRRNASAYNYVTLQRAMVAYQDATKNAPRTPDNERRATPRQTIIERASIWLCANAPYAPLDQVWTIVHALVSEDATLQPFYRGIEQGSLAERVTRKNALARAIQHATDARRTMLQNAPNGTHGA